MLDNMSDNISDDAQSDGDKATKRGMARSEIAFPYVSLEDALAVARAVHDNGAPLSRDQISGFLRLKSAHLRILGAKLFGLITEMPDGKVELTDLGISALSNDENENKAARRDAFLKVPLYSKAYEAFKNRNLPPRPTGLENAFVGFGVAPKQKDKARHAFERSASFAGFFDVNKDRLVEPIISRNPIIDSVRQWQEENQPHTSKPEPERKEPLPTPANDFLIKGLLDRLPPTTQKWSVDERARWLRALSVNLEMIYGEPSDTRVIEVTIPSRAAALIKKLEQPASQAKPQLPTESKNDLDDEIPF
jgi:hypothetical protein